MKRTFTLHFATINTMKNGANYEMSVGFTLHFATINTMSSSSFQTKSSAFTLHFATINTSTSFLPSSCFSNLHYTLLLLILNYRKCSYRK